MELKEIIKNLEHYNNWRRDNDNEYTMPEPKLLGLTIDAAISKLNELLICGVVGRSEQLCDCKYDKQEQIKLLTKLAEKISDSQK